MRSGEKVRRCYLLHLLRSQWLSVREQGEPVGAPVQGPEGELTWEVTTAWATLCSQHYVKEKSSYCSVSPFDLWGN